MVILLRFVKIVQFNCASRCLRKLGKSVFLIIAFFFLILFEDRTKAKKEKTGFYQILIEFIDCSFFLQKVNNRSGNRKFQWREPFTLALSLITS